MDLDVVSGRSRDGDTLAYLAGRERVLGSAVGRGLGETAASCESWLVELRRRRVAVSEALLDVDQGPSGDGRVLHRCPDGYRSILALAEICEACGWSPSLPVPALDECADRLVALFGWAEAEVWATALLDRVRATL